MFFNLTNQVSGAGRAGTGKNSTQPEGAPPIMSKYLQTSVLILLSHVVVPVVGHGAIKYHTILMHKCKEKSI